jgi:hypothetical protein
MAMPFIVKAQNNTTNNSSKKTSDTLIVAHNIKETDLIFLNTKQDSIDKELLKAKLEAERFRCTQPVPKMIEAKKAAEEQFKKTKPIKN